MNKIEIISTIIGAYELLSHAIPTKGNWSIFHKVFWVLKSLSERLNRNKPVKTNINVFLVYTFIILFLFASCNVIKNTNCASKKYVTVTVVLKDGYTYNLQVPYCDTIRLNNKKPDSLTNKFIIK